MLIENTKPGRRDGGYTRVVGNPELGALISRVHSANISSGNELEKIIKELAPNISVDDLLNKRYKEGVFLIDKKSIKRSILQGSQEPDFLVVKIEQSHCYIIELKDGDNFDTKKSKGEVENLKTYQNYISKKLPYKTSILVCFFNQENKDNIVKGFKGEISIDEAMTGREFCILLSISYDKIVTIREKDQAANLNFFINQLKKIPTIKNKLNN